MSNNQSIQNLEILGNKAYAAQNPSEAKLEVVPNKYPQQNYVARFTCPEFTSLCPVTNQPDFATIVIDYVPDQHIIESKSLKLFLQSFRNHNDFHEACTIYIANRLTGVAKPRWLRICSYWYPRGGIPIDVFFQTSEPPKNIWVEPIDIKTFQGR